MLHTALAQQCQRTQLCIDALSLLDRLMHARLVLS